MGFDITSILPNGLIVAAGTVAGWVFRDHSHRDDVRFREVANAFTEVSRKLDKAVETQAKSHAEILKILLEQKSE